MEQLIKLSLFDLEPLNVQVILKELNQHLLHVKLNPGEKIQSDQIMIVLNGEVHLNKEFLNQLDWRQQKGVYEALTHAHLCILKESVYADLVQKHTRAYIIQSMENCFKNVSRQTLNNMSHQIKFLRFTPGQSVFHAGEESDKVYYICQGEVKFLYNHAERQQIQPNRRVFSAVKRVEVIIIQAGSFFGESDCLNNVLRKYNAVCQGKVVILEYSYQLFQWLQKNDQGHMNEGTVLHREQIMSSYSRKALQLKINRGSPTKSIQILPKSYGEIHDKMKHKLLFAKTKNLQQQSVTQQNPIIKQNQQSPVKIRVRPKQLVKSSIQKDLLNLKALIFQQQLLNRVKTQQDRERMKFHRYNSSAYEFTNCSVQEKTYVTDL